jgi:hypothetical protein
MHQPIHSELAKAQCAAVDDVNRWRGHCIECFARIEQALGTALAALAADGRASEIKQPAMFGARLAALHQALALPAFAPETQKARATLDGLEAYLGRRNAIVHGVGKAWIDGRGEWMWAYRFQPFKRDAETGQIERDEAEAMERELASQGQSLSDSLRTLAATLGPSKARTA